MTTVKEYLENVTPAQQAEYERIHKIVKQIVPDVEEVISYGIPTFKYKGKYVLYFGAFKNHMSIFPGSELTAQVKDKLKGYKIAKGTIQFTDENPIPSMVLEEIIQTRLQDLKES